MTEAGHGAPDRLLVHQSSDGVSGGTLLRRAREAAGMHPASLAAALKVPVQKIEALEADRFDLLPDLVFVRALASSISRTLGVDPQPVLERLPRTAPPRLGRDRDRVNAPFRGRDDPVGPGWRAHFFRPVVLSVSGLMLAAGALILLPQSLLDDVAALARATLAPPAQPPAPDQGVAIPSSRMIEQEVPANIDSAAVIGPASASLATYSPASSAAEPESVGALVSAEAALPVPSPTVLSGSDEASGSQGILVFRTREASWIEVTDARGMVALRRMLAAGETAGVSGTLPLAVKVGKASVTDVLVRGQAFDMAAVTRDNVARFQVK
jgi:cytoskeleton protein RodZ